MVGKKTEKDIYEMSGKKDGGRTGRYLEERRRLTDRRRERHFEEFGVFWKV